MSRACRITPRASRDIEAIADYMAAQGNLDRADKFLTGITAARLPVLTGVDLALTAEQVFA